MNGFENSPGNPAENTPGPGTTDPSRTAAPFTDPFTANTTSASNDPYAPGVGSAPNYAGPGFVPPSPGLPNTGLATLLGFIPGVGAMYNGQFAKGLAQIVIFAVLISLANHVNGIFGLLIAGWYFYMVFDSYQTARARRDGLVAPDPFGLNSIGERLGIGNGPNWSDFTARPTSPQPPPYTPEYGAAGPHATNYPDPPAGSAGIPGHAAYRDAADAYNAQSAYTQPGYAQSAYAQPAYAQPPYAQAPYAQAPPAQPTYPPPFVPIYAPPLPSGSGLPTGAIWLIGFGIFALIGTLSHRFYWSNRYLDGAIVSAIGLVALITRALRARGVYPAGTAAATWYILRSSRIGLLLLAVGIALTLDNASWITWEYLWPYLLILLGVFLLVERACYNRMIAAGPVTPSNPGPWEAEPAEPIATPEPATSFVPSITPRNEEGQ